MGRVEWMALGGDQVEILLANLIYNHDGRAHRIRASQGDYGIDIIIPAATDSQKWDVYQVKKFAQNLTAGQKKQIVKSFGRALVGMLRRKVPLNDWHLVLPLDPTLENLDWLADVPNEAVAVLKKDKKLALTEAEHDKIRSWLEAPDRVIGWKGLTFCEKLAADYPYVVDYYLHGGSQRIKDAIADVAKLLQKDTALRDMDAIARPGEGSAALLEPGEIREHLLRLDSVLDTDPHYRYAHSLDVHPPPLHHETGLVAATQESIPGDRWLTFKIYARSAQSLDERPIPIKLEFEFEEASEEHQAFKQWIKYGKPFEGTATFTTDLPGGLHSGSMKGRVKILPASDSDKPSPLRFRILNPDQLELAQLRFTMRPTRGIENKGAWVHGTDDSGHLSAAMLIDEETRAGSINFKLAPLAGLMATNVLPALWFARNVAAPNILQIAGEVGPFFDFSPLPESEPLAEPAVERIVRALALIQTRTTLSVLIPDFSNYSPNDFKAIRRVASLIEGKTLVATWTDHTFRKNSEAEMAIGSHWEILLGERLRLPVITGKEELGLVEQLIASATIAEVNDNQVRCIPYKNNTVHIRLVNQLPIWPSGEMVVRCRPIPDDDDEGSDSQVDQSQIS
jgi:hypothetical protein